MSLSGIAQVLAGGWVACSAAALWLWLRKGQIIYGVPRRIFIGLLMAAVSTAIAAILLTVMLLLNPPLR